LNTLIPTPDYLLVPPGYFQFFLLLLFPIHLLFMNFMVGSAAISLYAHAKKGDLSGRLAHELARLLPILVAFAVNFGIAALLFLQVLYGQFFYSSSVLMGVFWLSVILMVMTVYYLLYIYDFRFARFRGGGVLVIGSAVLLLLAIPFLFTNNMTLMLRPGVWTAYFSDPHGTLLNLDDPTLIPRYLHMVVGALAVGGLFVACFGRYLASKDSQLGNYAVDLGMRVFGYLTLLQVVDGIFFLTFLPKDVKLMFLGGNPEATGIFLAAFLLAMVALAAGMRRSLAAAVCAVLPLVYFMSFVRAYVRSGFLKPYFSPERLEVVSRYSSMYAFLAVLVLGVLVLGWLFWKARLAMNQGEGP
jgi:hypothetical protein